MCGKLAVTSFLPNFIYYLYDEPIIIINLNNSLVPSYYSLPFPHLPLRAPGSSSPRNSLTRRATESSRFLAGSSSSRPPSNRHVPPLRYGASHSPRDHRPYPTIGESRGDKACPQSDDHENHPRY